MHTIEEGYSKLILKTNESAWRWNNAETQLLPNHRLAFLHLGISAAGGDQSVGVGSIFRFGREGGYSLWFLFCFYNFSLQSPVKIK